MKEYGFVTSEAIDWFEINNTREYHNFTEEDIFSYILSLCDPNNEDYNLNAIRCLFGKKKYNKNKKLLTITYLLNYY